MNHYLLSMLMLADTMTGFGRQKSFTLKGKIKGQTQGMLKLYYNVDGKAEIFN